jgi:dihydropteroate synthase
MVEAGADLIDVGGESTRPGSTPTPPEVEQARILPVIRVLAAHGLVVSVDTRHALTMRAALDAGASLVNDISGLADPMAAQVIAASGGGVVLMHSRGEPATMHQHAIYDDVVAEVRAALAARAAEAERCGIARGKIVIDPGLGFAKTAAHNLELLSRIDVLCDLGYTVLIGASRKRFIEAIAGPLAPKERVPGSIAAALYAASKGVRIVRVHDVAQTRQAFMIWDSITKP